MQGGGAGTAPSTFSLGGDCTLASPSITCTKTGGVTFGSLATLNAAQAGTLTGATLAASVLNSSLTKIGSLSTLTDSGGATVSPLAVNAPNVVGDGTTNNNTAFQAALTAATASAPGGTVQCPCGTFKLTAAMTATIPNNSILRIAGAGKDCTKLAYSGAVDGFNITYGNGNSSIDLRDLAITTDQAGGQNAIALTQATASNVVNVANELRNLNFHGDSLLTGGTNHYWGNAIVINNVSNVNIDDIDVNNGVKGQGNGVFIQGNVGSSFYQIVANFVNPTFTNCGSAIKVGDFSQGVQIVNGNFTGCSNGILVPAGATGNLSELEISNSQFGYNDFDIKMLSFMDNLHLSNNLFLDQTGGSGVLAASSYYTITGNTWLSSTGGIIATPLHITNLGQATHAGNIGTVTGNTFFNLLSGIQIDLNAGPSVTGNNFTSVPTPIVNNSVTAYIDSNPGSGFFYSVASLPACGAASQGLSAAVTGAAALAWGATITTGAVPYRGWCNGTNWTVSGK